MLSVFIIIGMAGILLAWGSGIIPKIIASPLYAAYYVDPMSPIGLPLAVFTVWVSLHLILCAMLRLFFTARHEHPINSPPLQSDS